MRSGLYGILLKLVSVLMMSGLALVAPAQFHHHSDNGDICLCGIFHISSSDSACKSHTHDNHRCSHHHSSESSRVCDYIVLDNADTAPDNTCAPVPSEDNQYAVLETSLSDPDVILGELKLGQVYIIKPPKNFSSTLSLRAPPVM